MFEVNLPSGKVVSIKPPVFMDRMNSVKEFRQVQREVGYILEELMAAKAITAVDGNVVEHGFIQDPVMIMSDWSNLDVQYYIEFFMTAFFPDEKLKEKAQEEAKKLLTGQPSSMKPQAKRTSTSSAA